MKVEIYNYLLSYVIRHIKEAETNRRGHVISKQFTPPSRFQISRPQLNNYLLVINEFIFNHSDGFCEMINTDLYIYSLACLYNPEILFENEQIKKMYDDTIMSAKVKKNNMIEIKNKQLKLINKILFFYHFNNQTDNFPDKIIFLDNKFYLLRR